MRRLSSCRSPGLGLVASGLVLVVPALWLLASAGPVGAATTSSVPPSVGPSAASAVASIPAEPVVAFLGGDLVPLACSATPDPPSLIVQIGTRVTLANFTGADATVDIGAALPVEVPAGTAISVRFCRGE